MGGGEAGPAVRRAGARYTGGHPFIRLSPPEKPCLTDMDAWFQVALAGQWTTKENTRLSGPTAAL